MIKYRKMFLLAAALVTGTLSLTNYAVAQDKTAVATFGSGCFWCTESDFDKVSGVLTTVSGFMGGHVKKPSYRQVSRGGTGHTEVVQITYDPSKVTYAKLVEFYWRHVDPFDNSPPSVKAVFHDLKGSLLQKTMYKLFVTDRGYTASIFHKGRRLLVRHPLNRGSSNAYSISQFGEKSNSN